MSRIHSLLEKITGQQATPEECEELLQMLESAGHHESIDKMDAYFGSDHSSAGSLDEAEKEHWRSAARQIIQLKFPEDEISGEVHEETKTALVSRMPKFRKWALAAACIVFLLVVGQGVYWRMSSEKSSPGSNNYSFTDIQPGGEKATLTLGDGSRIVLDDVENGDLAQQGHAKIKKLRDGQLIYDAAEDTKGTVAYNTLSVPRGGQYALTLSDGTKVWLNASSSIKYPSVFEGEQRLVEISGEAYLEIAKNTHQPFVVKTDKTEIRVLGTSFNVNAYDDENSEKTTLVDGSARVIKSSSAQAKLLIPGQQAEIAEDVDGVKVQAVDTEHILAWKNGFFSFNNADIKTVMRQLSRWYDINIVYENGVPRQYFVGEMNRSLTLSQVLKGLEVTKVNFRLEGRNLIVMP